MVRSFIYVSLIGCMCALRRRRVYYEICGNIKRRHRLWWISSLSLLCTVVCRCTTLDRHMLIWEVYEPCRTWQAFFFYTMPLQGEQAMYCRSGFVNAARYMWCKYKMAVYFHRNNCVDAVCVIGSFLMVIGSSRVQFNWRVNVMYCVLAALRRWWFSSLQAAALSAADCIWLPLMRIMQFWPDLCSVCVVFLFTLL